MMSSSSIKNMRRKKTLGDVKIAVIGATGVGKSALTVRFLTKRYIGEYDHQNENRYKHEVMVDGETVIFEILDSCPKSLMELIPLETLDWADGFLLVYSITDRQSFNYIKRIKQQLLEYKKSGTSNMLTVNTSLSLPNNNNSFGESSGNSSSASSIIPMILVGNKADLIHLRQISTEEGEILAKDLDSSFEEVAASEQVTQVAELFHEVYREIQAAKKKTKQSLLDRVLGNKAAAGLRVYARGKSDSALPKE